MSRDGGQSSGEELCLVFLQKLIKIIQLITGRERNLVAGIRFFWYNYSMFGEKIPEILYEIYNSGEVKL